MTSGYILESPGALSARAVRFLRTASHRVPIDHGLTGERLRREIDRVHGRPDDDIVALLDRLQKRYSGLSYGSGFFQSKVTFSPVCEPEHPDEELEILYAVETGSIAGASVKPTGEVEIGIDALSTIEFRDLDTLIECDALYAEASGSERRSYFSPGPMEEVLNHLMSDPALGLHPAPEASGHHTHWLTGADTLVALEGAWATIDSRAPMIRSWPRHQQAASRLDAVLRGFRAERSGDR
ncbi:hypothetical protein GCM10010435_34080 [Winogradskya consettensis]|uniref:Uncharacterized protein n=1 Tax=Winogradskya consettensis TaxID=113560 RepID=A0A919SCI6_9ACTN|nr:hypothetical protein [Actinoplanes consettensis]GIM69892.1 hypothetical protein Aco04nite_17410 [Actinoplanes consettensis]